MKKNPLKHDYWIRCGFCNEGHSRRQSEYRTGFDCWVCKECLKKQPWRTGVRPKRFHEMLKDAYYT